MPIYSHRCKLCNINRNIRQDISSPTPSTELVILGLGVKRGTSADIKQLAAAAIRVVYPDLDRRDIISARLMIPRSALNLSKTTRLASIPEGGGTTSTVAPDVSQDSANSTENSEFSTTANRPLAIAVALGSRPLLIEVLRSKARLGKLHSSACTPHLPAGLEATDVIPGLINFHEYLPGALFKVHRYVRSEAKRLRENSEPGFVHYISKGQIYVRRRKGLPSSMISSEEDLHRFLAL